MNINPITLKEYSITDLLEINAELISKIRTTSAEKEGFNEYLSNISDDDLRVQLLSSKFYRTDKNIVVLFEVPHAVGDIIEVTID